MNALLRWPAHMVATLVLIAGTVGEVSAQLGCRYCMEHMGEHIYINDPDCESIIGGGGDCRVCILGGGGIDGCNFEDWRPGPCSAYPCESGLMALQAASSVYDVTFIQRAMAEYPDRLTLDPEGAALLVSGCAPGTVTRVDLDAPFAALLLDRQMNGRTAGRRPVRSPRSLRGPTSAGLLW